ncbi:hypothetical protein IT399_00745 [Candidatus Nomurabacteria bacterium]|nr:hypothetical protein [Candidatus Nomurabacteria bacterium]
MERYKEEEEEEIILKTLCSGIIGPTDGSLIIKQTSWVVDKYLENLKESTPTEKTDVRIDTNGGVPATISLIFGAYEKDFRQICLTQSQIVELCIEKPSFIIKNLPIFTVLPTKQNDFSVVSFTMSAGGVWFFRSIYWWSFEVFRDIHLLVKA